MSNVPGEKARVEELCGCGDGEVRDVDSAIPGKPPPTEVTGDLGNGVVEHMPEDHIQQSSRRVLLRGAHPDENLEACDFASVEFTLSASSLDSDEGTVVVT